MKLGVLAAQGAFSEHVNALQKLGAVPVEVRKKQDFTEDLEGLILPGGESTTIGKLLVDLSLFEPIKERILAGLPVFGTCAGLILLADKIMDQNKTYFGCMDIVCRRNAYGRQLGSFFTEASFANCGKVPMTFIRAPYIEACGEDVTPLATVEGKVVSARQKNMLVCAFHPELTDDLTVHQYFLEEMVKHGKETI